MAGYTDRVQEVANLVETIVEYKTVESNNQELERCRNTIKNYFSDTDLIIREHESNGCNSVVVLNQDTTEPKVMLHGHYDVVNGKDKLFDPWREDGKIYGRGTADMKAGLACMMRVMKEMEDSEVSLMLAATPDEEIGGLNGTKHLIEDVYSPSFGISSEPNNVKGRYMDIIAKQKGLVTFTMSLEKPFFHSTKPWMGTDAADKLVKKYVEITDRFSDPDEREWSTTTFLKKMESSMNKKNPNQAELTFSVYPAGDYTLEEIIEQVKSVDDIDVDLGFRQKVLDTDYENFYVQKLLESAKKSIEGEEPKVMWKAPPSDMGHLYSQGIPAVVFGPEGYNSHGDNEYAVIDSFEEYMNSLMDFLEGI
ncbi:M20/M25/M40 family metallo-hydrolase [Nanohaloarchaea archaeon]|nr:M20/M25/M40 family metallo-hydrolase [Candidatus Nanohaloarchaea archaeon]